MMKMRSKVYLPEDLIVEILSTVPAISLARLRSTSKRWNALFKDGRFAKKHSANAPRHSSLALGLVGFRVYVLSVDLHGTEKNIVSSVKVTGQLSLKDPLSSSSEEVCIRSVFHCDGLLLCITKNHRLVVWNPLLGETKWIQGRNSDKESYCYALGYDNRSSCYKILRMDRSGYGDLFQTEFEVYDFTFKAWRVVGKIRDWYIQLIECPRRGLSVKGNTYWRALCRSSGHVLLSFDFSGERFQLFSLPADAPCFYENMVLSETREGQQLCLLATEAKQVQNINVWMATKIESTGAISWSKFLTVTSADLSYHSQFNYGMSFLADHENKVIVSFNSMYANIIHIVGEDKYIKLKLHGAVPIRDSPPPFLLSYVPSLVQI